MAEFCKQCSEEIFGEDTGDFKGLSTERDTKDERYPVVLCEGCGETLVNHLGECVLNDCLITHTPEKYKWRKDEIS